MLAYRDTVELDLTELVSLRERVGFPQLSQATISAQIQGSRWVWSAWDEARIVGFVRAISDGTTNAYVCAMMVHPNYRRRGIARELMRRLTADKPHIRWVLHSREEAVPFYQAIDFAPLAHAMWRDRKPAS